MSIGETELSQWLMDNVVKRAMGPDYSPSSWRPLEDSYDARRVAFYMKQLGWKVKIRPVRGLEWSVSFNKWDAQGSMGAKGGGYGCLESSICYAAYFAILAMRAVEAVQP